MEYDAKAEVTSEGWHEFRDSTLENIQDHVFKFMWILGDEFSPDSVELITHGRWVGIDRDKDVSRSLAISCFGVPVYEAHFYRDDRPPKLRMSRGVRGFVRHFLAENQG